MATTLLDNYVGGRGGQIYYNGTSVEYPNDQYNVFPTLYLPRVYGKDLTAFEIASSGKISVTVRDIYSFDLERDVPSSNIILQTMSNDSFQISVNESNMGLLFDSKSNVVTIATSNQLFIDATSNVTIQSKSLTFDVSDLGLQGDNVYVTANSNLHLTAKDDTIYMMSGSNIKVSSSNNIQFSSCNDYVINSASNLTLEAANNSMKLSFDAITDTLSVVSACNMNLSGGSCNMMIHMNAATNTAMIDSKNDILITASSNIAVGSTTGSTTLFANQSNVTIILDSDANSMNMYSSNNMTLHTDNNILMMAQSNIVISANESNVAILLDSTMNKLAIFSSNDISINTSNNINVYAQSNYTLKTDQGHILLSGNSHQGNLILDSNVMLVGSNDVLLTALSNASLKGSTVHVTAAQGTLDFVDNKTSLTTSQPLFLSTSNIFNLISESNIFLSAQNGDTRISLDEGIIANTNTSYTFKIANSNLVEIDSTRMRVNGNLEVLGVLDNISIQQTTLEVRDKLISLAYSPDGDVLEDGVGNDAGGLVINGIPSGELASDSNLFEKSIRWHNAGGMSLLGTPAFSNDSYWEVKGGGLKLTHTKLTGSPGSYTASEVSFGFRINEHDELEIVKKFSTDGTTYQYKRVAKFGRMLL